MSGVVKVGWWWVVGWCWAHWWIWGYDVILQPDAVTWHDANSYCIDLGKTLLTIWSREENDALVNSDRMKMNWSLICSIICRTFLTNNFSCYYKTILLNIQIEHDGSTPIHRASKLKPVCLVNICWCLCFYLFIREFLSDSFFRDKTACPNLVIRNSLGINCRSVWPTHAC